MSQTQPPAAAPVPAEVPAGAPPVGAGDPEQSQVETFWGKLRRFVRTQPLGAASLALITFFVLIAIFAPLIAPHDPLFQNRQHFTEAPSAQFWMGTDSLGRDILSRVIFGARTSLLIAVITVMSALTIGTIIGVVSGYIGKWVDMVLQRVMDAVLSVPALVLLLFIAALLGPSIRNTIIAFIVVTVPQFNRVARGEILRVREEPFIEAARATGTPTLRIMLRHGLPNIVAALMTVASLVFAVVIIAEAGISFLGLGTPPPTPSWGRMLSEATRFMERAPWMVLFPGAVLSLAVFAFNLLGDALRDFFDPKIQGR